MDLEEFVNNGKKSFKGSARQFMLDMLIFGTTDKWVNVDFEPKDVIKAIAAEITHSGTEDYLYMIMDLQVSKENKLGICQPACIVAKCI